MSSMKMKRLKWVAGITLVALIMSGVIVFYLATRSARLTLPNPNGYDDLRAAGRQVSGEVGNFAKLDYDELRDLISANSEVLGVIRIALSRQCVVPLDAALTNVAGAAGELADLKHLAQLLAAEGRLREMDKRQADAARSYLDCLRLGNDISRGGFFINRLVGIACEAIGYSSLASLLPKLSQAENRALLGELEKIDTGRVTWDEVVQSEKRCTLYHLKQHWNPAIWVVGWWNNRAAVKKTEERHNTAIAHERLLMAELALCCYKFEKGVPPARLEDLVPNYLSRVPQDPFSAKPMIYRPRGGIDDLVYSVGPDGLDDGGRPATRGWPIKGDILVDSSW
jgi:hypothetical protein